MEKHSGLIRVIVITFLISQPLLILLYFVGLFPFDFFYVFTPFLLIGYGHIFGIYTVELVKFIKNLFKRKRN